MEARTLCPITGGNATHERNVSTQFIIDGYLTNYDIDVAKLFQGKEEISIFKSSQTDLRFFGPNDVAGDGFFYEQLQKYPWYYMEWKWEHSAVKKLLQPGMRVLELGCGEGAFLRGIADKCPDSVGLELNDAAVAAGQATGLNVLADPIQDHARTHPGQYDIVCSFQVMEHVTDIRAIVEASVKCLKPGGKLLISVPNNDSFIKRSENSLLNLPPHHMNLWDANSLEKLAYFFDMSFEGHLIEPLQAYHYPVVTSNWVFDTFPGILGKMMNRLVKMTKAYKLAGLWRNKIVGHSIISIYTRET